MLAFIEGAVVNKDGRSVIVQSGGLGFRILTTATTLKKIPQAGGQVKIWTNLVVRDDRMELFGFLAPEELDFFSLLNSVAGIGPKSALAILDAATLDQLQTAIGAGDTTILTRISGIGKKSADRIIVELRSKVAPSRMSAETLGANLDAEEALTSLGYSHLQARAALEKLSHDVVKPEDRVREALKILGRK